VQVSVIKITFDLIDVMLTSHLQICIGRKEAKGKLIIVEKDQMK